MTYRLDEHEDALLLFLYDAHTKDERPTAVDIDVIKKNGSFVPLFVQFIMDNSKSDGSDFRIVDNSIALSPSGAVRAESLWLERAHRISSAEKERAESAALEENRWVPKRHFDVFAGLVGFVIFQRSLGKKERSFGFDEISEYIPRAFGRTDFARLWYDSILFDGDDEKIRLSEDGHLLFRELSVFLILSATDQQNPS